MFILKGLTALILLSVFFTACNNDSDVPTTQPTVIYKEDTAVLNAQNVKRQAPVINIIDTVQFPGYVLVIKDSAMTSEGIGKKMHEIYTNTLPTFITEKKLNITGPRYAWYTSSSAPFFFEAGFPIDKKPTGKLPPKMKVREIKRDSAVVAHYFGPYESTYQAYGALKEWMKDYKKKSSGQPYEIYVGSMYDAKGNPVDPYRVQTDIIFPHK